MRAALFATSLLLLAAGPALAAGDLVPAGTCGPGETVAGDTDTPTTPDGQLGLRFDSCYAADSGTNTAIYVWAWNGFTQGGEEYLQSLEQGEFALAGFNVERQTLAGREVVVVDPFGSDERWYYVARGDTVWIVETANAAAAQRALSRLGSGGGTAIVGVPGPAQISLDPVIVATSAVAAAGVAVAVPFPGTLFNSTLDANYAEVAGWFRRFGRGAAGMRAGIGQRLGAFFATPRGVAVFIGLAAVLYGFLDPGFGPNLDGLLTVIGLAGGLALLAVVGQLPVRAYTARHLGERGRLEVRPAGLLIALGCVLITRITDFQPGYLYGLLAGFSFSRELEPRQDGAASAIGAATSLALALLAFMALGVLRAPFGGTAPGWLLPAEVGLATVVIGGIEDVLFGLLPVRFLPGEAVVRWSRVAWALLFGLSAFAFLHVLINPSSGYLVDTTIQPLFKVVALAVGFGLVSVLFWAYFRYRRATVGPTASAPSGQ